MELGLVFWDSGRMRILVLVALILIFNNVNGISSNVINRNIIRRRSLFCSSSSSSSSSSIGSISSSGSDDIVAITKVEIQYCTGCKWMLRSAWLAQGIIINHTINHQHHH